MEHHDPVDRGEPKGPRRTYRPTRAPAPDMKERRVLGTHRVGGVARTRAMIRTKRGALGRS